MILSFFFLIIRPPPTSTLFPTTPFFRSPLAPDDRRLQPVPRLDHDLLGLDRRRAVDEELRIERDHELLTVVGRIQHLLDRKSTRLNSSHANISYAVFCLKKKNFSSQII